MSDRLHMEIYEDRAHEWRWRIVALNGRTLADSGEGYATRASAKRAGTTLIATIEHHGVPLLRCTCSRFQA